MNTKNIAKNLFAGLLLTTAVGAASLLVALVYFAGGMLEKAEVIGMDAGIAMIWVFPMLCGIYGIAKMILTRRYQ